MGSRSLHVGRTQRATALTRDELLALPAAVPLWPTAARAVNIGRTKAHELARAGEFPVAVLRLGASYRVRTADLLAYLGIEDQPGGTAA
jgi:helix-turn-helix protein